MQIGIEHTARSGPHSPHQAGAKHMMSSDTVQLPAVGEEFNPKLTGPGVHDVRGDGLSAPSLSCPHTIQHANDNVSLIVRSLERSSFRFSRTCASIQWRLGGANYSTDDNFNLKTHPGIIINNKAGSIYNHLCIKG